MAAAVARTKDPGNTFTANKAHDTSSVSGPVYALNNCGFVEQDLEVYLVALWPVTYEYLLAYTLLLIY